LIHKRNEKFRQYIFCLALTLLSDAAQEIGQSAFIAFPGGSV
jgi:hypothetical protein